MALYIDPNPKSTIILMSSDDVEFVTNTKGVCLSAHLEAQVKDCFPDKIKLGIDSKYVEKISEYMNKFEDLRWVETFIRTNEQIIIDILKTDFVDITLLQTHFETYNYVILTSDTTKIKVRYIGAIKSKIVSNIIEDCYNKDGITIGVDDESLRIIADYMNHYDDEAWVQQFIDDSIVVDEYKDDRGLDKTRIHDSVMEKILLSSDFLDIPTLSKLAVVKMASIIESKTPAEIREYFELPPDFTFADQEKARVDTKWHYKP